MPENSNSGSFTDAHRLREQDYHVRMLELLTADRPLREALVDLILLIEREVPGMNGSVLLLSRDGRRVIHGAAPNLPEFYVEAIDGVEIGEGVGSCGTAAYTKQRVIVEDIETHPFWQNFKGLALEADLRACWSQPIVQSDNVLGTFALYYHEPRTPTDADLHLIEEASGLAKVLIEKHLAQQVNDFSHRIFENSPMGILVVNDDDSVGYLNPSMANVVGEDRDALVGTCIKDLYRDAAGSEYLSLIRKGIGDRGAWQGELPFRSKTGQLYYLEQVASLDLQEDGSHRVIVTSIDVTATRQASEKLKYKERLLELAMDTASITYWQLDFKNLGVDLSRPDSILPVTKDRYPEYYRSFFQIMHVDDRPVMLKSFLDYVNGKTDRHRCEYRLLCKDGNYHWFQATGHFVEHDDQGVPSLMIGFHQEYDTVKSLTDEMHLQVQERTRELELATKAAEVAAQSKTSFLANMSHEIRTPLNGIIGVTDLLGETSLTAQQRDYLKTVTVSANTLLTVINDILDISKVNEGMMTLEKVVFNFADFVKALLAAYQTQSETDVVLMPDIDSSIPLWLEGDPTRLHQVLGNILSNAFKFTRQGSVSFLVRSESQTDGLVTLLFEIRDTGIGIPAEAQKRIFDKFEQADLSTTREFGGSGLGLSICNKLVQLFGGDIWVESTEGKGTSFFVRLSLGEACPPEETEVDRLSAESFSGARILVAEDNVVNQKVIGAMLKKFDVEFDLAENGEEAVAMVNKNSRYDLIFMDCEMPKMDGYEATRQIRQWEQSESQESMTICALTSHAMSEHRDQCLDAGMNDHLAKPVTLQSLKEVLRRCIPG